MKTNNNIAAVSAVLVSLLLVMTLLAGCGGNKAPEETPGPVTETEPVSQPAPEETPAAETDPGMADGERFEATVTVEGMEETVGYEHVRNEAMGFELDFEYESLERRSEQDRERFVSVYDDPDEPWNYLEVRYSPEDEDTAVAAVYAELSEGFGMVLKDAAVLERAGECTRIDASGVRGGNIPGEMQTVYVIPADAGCFIAAEHYTAESAEGFGARFSAAMDTFSVLGS